MSTRRDDTIVLTLTPLATFSGLRGVPLLALSRNSLYPQLVIARDAVTVRVMRRHRFTYDDLARVYAERGDERRITLAPKRGWRTFTASFSSRAQAQHAVEALAARGAPMDPDLLAQFNCPSS